MPCHRPNKSHGGGGGRGGETWYWRLRSISRRRAKAARVAKRINRRREKGK